MIMEASADPQPWGPFFCSPKLTLWPTSGMSSCRYRCRSRRSQYWASETWRAPRRWRPLPASLAGGAQARPDHPIPRRTDLCSKPVSAPFKVLVWPDMLLRLQPRDHRATARIHHAYWRCRVAARSAREAARAHASVISRIGCHLFAWLRCGHIRRACSSTVHASSSDSGST